jgi:hypothetical protein
MRKIQRSVVLAFALLAVFVGQASAGQKSATSRAGEEVIVTQSGSGEELRGRLVELSSTSMSMLVNGERVDVPIEDVLRIDARNDSLKNGTIIGAAIMGGLSALACAEISNAGGCAMVLATNTGIGALAGAGIDALHKGRTPIYIKAGKSEAGLQVRLRF